MSDGRVGRLWHSGIAPASFLLFLLVIGGSVWVAAVPSEDEVAFGIDAPAATGEERLWHVQYGTLWIGAWNLKEGWQEPVHHLERMRAHDVVPVIQLYYWGDDLSPRCFASGCWSELHGAHKDAAAWDRLTEELLGRLNETMGGERVLILLENEFNQIHTKGHDGFDRALAAKAHKIRAGYPAADIVLPFGNWDPDAWGTWDEAAGASDYVGIQALRASTRHAPDAYEEAFEATLRGVERLHMLFGKPIIVHDVGFSSYPEPAFLEDQADALQAFFIGLPALKEAGVRALMYRAFTDDPKADPANWFGEAERHWGLAWSGNGTLKPAGMVWLSGVAGVVPDASGSTEQSTGAGRTAKTLPDVGAESRQSGVAGDEPRPGPGHEATSVRGSIVVGAAMAAFVVASVVLWLRRGPRG